MGQFGDCLGGADLSISLLDSAISSDLVLFPHRCDRAKNNGILHEPRDTSSLPEKVPLNASIEIKML